MAESVQLPLRIDLRSYVVRIQAPSLVLWGEQDWTIPLRSGRELSQIIGAEMVIIKGGHHEWSIFQPEELYNNISDFILAVGE